MVFPFLSKMANHWKRCCILSDGEIPRRNTKMLSLEAANAGNGVDGFITTATHRLHNKGNKYSRTPTAWQASA